MQPRLDRLATLADYLETVVPTKPNGVGFDLEVWQGEPDNPDETCGTVCCAVGHACQIPQFREAGLALKCGAPYYLLPEPIPHRWGSLTELWGWQAVQEFFGLTEAQANHLFDSMRYLELFWTDPLTVAGRIRGFIADHRSWNRSSPPR